MAEPARLELTLLGETLAVRTEATPDHVRAIARYLEARVDEARRGGANDLTKALMLAALDITDELFREREGRTRRDGDVDARLTALLELLEAATRPTRGT